MVGKSINSDKTLWKSSVLVFTHITLKKESSQKFSNRSLNRTVHLIEIEEYLLNFGKSFKTFVRVSTCLVSESGSLN